MRPPLRVSVMRGDAADQLFLFPVASVLRWKRRARRWTARTRWLRHDGYEKRPSPRLSFL